MQTLSPSSPATASLQHVSRLKANQKLAGNIGRVGFSASGIKLHPLGFAPLWEFVGAKVHAQHPQSASLKRLLATLSGIQPSLISAIGCNATVVAKRDQTRVVFGLKPNQGSCLGAEIHSVTSAVEALQFNSSVTGGTQKNPLNRATAAVLQQLDKVIVSLSLTRQSHEFGEPTPSRGQHFVAPAPNQQSGARLRRQANARATSAIAPALRAWETLE